MHLYKCDLCGHVQELGEKFYNLTDITPGDRGIDIEFCSECFRKSIFSTDKTNVKEKQV